MKKLVLVSLIGFNLIFGIAQESDNVVTEKLSIDSLLMSNKPPIYVKAEVVRVDYTNADGCEYCDYSDTSITIKDYKNNVLFKMNIPTAFDNSNYIIPSSTYLEGIGNVLMIHTESNPTVSSDQGSNQFFGFNKDGIIVPITGIIPISGEFADKSIFKPHKITRNNEFKKINETCDNCSILLETSNHTGFCGFNIGEFYRVDLEGKQISSKPYKAGKQSIYAGNGNLKTVDVIEYAESVTIQLYQKPDTGSKKKSVSIKVGTVIKFNYVIRNNQNSFISLNINGEEGYVNDWNFLGNIGYPACD